MSLSRRQDREHVCIRWQAAAWRPIASAGCIGECGKMPGRVSSLLCLQNGSVAEAISLWKRNVDKEFEGGWPPRRLHASSVHPCALPLGGSHSCSSHSLCQGTSSSHRQSTVCSLSLSYCPAFPRCHAQCARAVETCASTAPACRPRGVPDLLQHHPAHKRPAAAPGVGAAAACTQRCLPALPPACPLPLPGPLV